ncbi:MAG: GDP-fucose synthetase [Desulfobulbaceae bacterium]|nr:MAG: GDP-fucose synthetase [Desulfobulbaceae bacterium]
MQSASRTNQSAEKETSVLTPQSSILSPHSRIYIAGHRGLVGSALVRKLLANGHNPESLVLRTHKELDLTDQAAVRNFFAKEKPEFVFLAAAKVGGIHANNTYPADFIYQNLAIQTNVIHAAYRAGVKRLIFLGSSCIYPRDCPQPMQEEYLLTGPLEATNRPYAVAKIAGIEMCWAYNRQYGTKYLAVMPTNLYGPGDNYDLENSHVLPALIRKCHLAKLAMEGNLRAIQKDEEIHGPIPKDIKEAIGLSPDSSLLTPHSSPKVVLWGTGSPRREFLYSEDMADATIFLANLPADTFSSLLTPDSAPLINIGCGKDQTIQELAALVKEVVGFQGELTFDSRQPDGTPRKLLGVDRLTRLGWQPRIPLAHGIKQSYEDYQAGAKGKV